MIELLNYREQERVAAYVEQASATHDFLQRQRDLSPTNPQVNRVLSAFVGATMQKRSAKEVRTILNMPRIQEIAPGLRQLAGKAEYEMECFAAAAMAGHKKITPETAPYASFDNFIYRQNYESLIDLEITALRRKGRQPPLNRKTQSVAFVGAGPLPMSAILFHQRTGHPVTCIDSDEKACNLGRQLIHHLAATQPARYAGLPGRVNFVHADGAAHDYVTHPVVLVASLVDGKDAVLMQIVNTSRTGGRFLIRTAKGLSTLLYKPHDIIAGLEEYNVYPLHQTKADHLTINTSVSYYFPPGKMWQRNRIDAQSASDAMPGYAADLTGMQSARRPRRRHTPGLDVSI